MRHFYRPARPPPGRLDGGRPMSRQFICFKSICFYAVCFAASFAVTNAIAADITARIYTSDDPMLQIGGVSVTGSEGQRKDFKLSVGIGSAAFHSPNDAPNVVWTAGDRGPNVACSDMKEIVGFTPAACSELKNGRLFLTPSYTPSLYRVILLDDGTFRVTDAITLKDRDGRPLSAMPNPLKTATTDAPFDATGKKLELDANGLDVEGIVRLADGTFWIGEENAPSIAHVAADGRLIERHVPKGTEGEFAGARYDVKGTLPAILAKRQANRGIEGFSMSPDEKFLYVLMQNPLANPDAAAHAKAKNTRLLKIEREGMTIVGEYVYTLDDPQSFRRDPSEKQSDVRISDLMGIGTDLLVVDERTEKTTKLYEIDLTGATNILGTKWDDAATAPSLEQTALDAAQITPAKKTLRLDTADFPDIVGKTEGVALLGDGSLLIVNDDDFGITGEKTQIVVLKGTGIARH
jgi:hypothetical protein